MNRATQNASLTLLVRGLRIEAHGVEGSVVHLAVRANKQHQGVFGRLRQHLADALFRIADACHPSQHNGPLWVVEPVVGAAPRQDQLAHGAEPGVRYIWPRHDSLGQAHYNALFVHEGVKRHQDGRPVAGGFFGQGGQERADYSHAAPFAADKTVLVLADDQQQ